MGHEIELVEVFESLGLDPSEWCMKIDGIRKVDETTLDKGLYDKKIYRGHGCYQTRRHNYHSKSGPVTHDIIK